MSLIALLAILAIIVPASRAPISPEVAGLQGGLYVGSLAQVGVASTEARVLSRIRPIDQGIAVSFLSHSEQLLKLSLTHLELGYNSSPYLSGSFIGQTQCNSIIALTNRSSLSSNGH